MLEIWKPVEGFDHYEISNLGRVKSKQRKILKFRGLTQHLKTVNERIMKPALTSNGYLFLVLMKDGIKKSIWIHKEVARSFVAGKKKGLVVHHLNGVKTDNHHLNLEYVSMQKNTNEYYKSIGKSKGKISYSEIPKIIDLINNGAVIKDLAEKYNVSRNDMATISKIIDCGQELNTSGLI